MGRELGSPLLVEVEEDESHEGIPAICPYCFEEGQTVLSDASIRGYALSPLKTWSFECPSCGHRSREVELPNVGRSEGSAGVRIERVFEARSEGEEGEAEGAKAAEAGEAGEGAEGAGSVAGGEAGEGAEGAGSVAVGEAGEGAEGAGSVAVGEAAAGACVASGSSAAASSPLDLLMVRCETALLSIPELEFEIPPGATSDAPLLRGDVASVRDVLGITVDNLNLNQADRAPETAAIIEETIDALRACRDGRRTFTIVLEDPTGLSFIEQSQDEPTNASKDAKVA